MKKRIEERIEGKIEKEFGDFLVYLQSEKNASEATIANYTTDFGIFKSFLLKNDIIANSETISTQDIRGYIAYLKINKKYATATIRRKINSLKSFFNFLTNHDYVLKNPTRIVTTPKKENSLPKFFTESQVKQLLEVAKNRKSNFALRDFMFVKLIAYAGLRRAEAIGLDFTDVDFGENKIKVKGKGRKERVIPISEDFSDEFFLYFQSRLPLRNNAVFINGRGNRINASKAHQIFTALLEESGLNNKGLTIHSLRHGYATALVNKGVDIAQIQALLGHSDINTTTVYTHISVEDLREDIKKLPY